MHSKETIPHTFSDLRKAYTTVKSFLETESMEQVKSLNTKVAEDLSLYGDDNCEMIEKFVSQFKLDYKEFNYFDHFHTEGELFGSIAAVFNMLAFPVWIIVKLFELITRKKTTWAKDFFFKTSRQVTDLTFREMLVWYIDGSYTKGKQNLCA